ncbi:MAG: hypothetical protein VYC85_01165 [Pseudomonadota bacterium]|nr:hypothetical protein [Pseudomonadota bacterium]
MKIRNWHKRQLRGANEIESTATVSNGGEQWRHVQISFRSDEKGSLRATMTPEEAAELRDQLNHCIARYEVS